MTRECDYCGAEFNTLTRLRLHQSDDCDGKLISDFVASGMDVSKLPERRQLTEDELNRLRSHDDIENVKNVLDNPVIDGAISLVVETNSEAIGFHSDHDTGEWLVTASGSEYETVKKRHLEFVSEDIARVEGGEPPHIDNIDDGVPESVTVDCPHCDDEHTAYADFDPFLLEMGQMEYNGYCEKVGKPIVRMNPDGVLE